MRTRVVITLAAALLLPCWASAQNQEFQKLLDKTSTNVSAFLDHFSDVKCTENVTQVKFNSGGHALYTERSTYDYFVLLEASPDDLIINESRLREDKNDRPGKNISLLLTNGFSTLFLMFHPFYRDSFEFAPDGYAVVNSVRLARVRFRHIPGTRTPAALAVRGREFPLELMGTAWIDPQSGAIARIQSGLANNMQDVGLKTLSAQVDYDPIKLPGWKDTYRFPVVATIDVETLRQHWRNVHRFSNYKRFLVDTEQKVSDENIAKAAK